LNPWVYLTGRCALAAARSTARTVSLCDRNRRSDSIVNHNPHFWDGLGELPSVFYLSVALLSYWTPPGRVGLSARCARGSWFRSSRDRRGRLFSVRLALSRS